MSGIKTAFAIGCLGTLCQGQDAPLPPLHPTAGFRTAHSAGVALPFNQTLPLPKGKLFPKQLSQNLTLDGKTLPAQAKIAAYWSDGSIQWLTLRGVWPQDLPLPQAPVLQLGPAQAAPKPEAPFSLQQQDGSLQLHYQGKLFATLQLEAGVVPISKPKARDSRAPEDYDTRVQYAWAEPIDQLSQPGQEISLQPVIREFLLEQDDADSLLYRIRGNGGTDGPGADLEWQLRLRIFRHTPVIRFQTTWFLHWSPEKFALSKARLIATFPQEWQQGRNQEQSYQLKGQPVQLVSDYSGRSQIIQNDQKSDAEWPAPERHAWTLSNAAATLGIAVPNFTRLGPNRLSLDSTRLQLDSWDGESGLALDTRRTVERDEFMMDSYDFDDDASGLAKTSEMTWCLTASERTAAAIASAEATRQGLWFPSRADLIASKAMGNWKEETFAKHTAYIEGLTGQMYWLMASRDHWRWNGFINYGDVRTNWTRGGWVKDGVNILYPMYWGMHGRYGWRNGSGEPYAGFLNFGLWTQDREVILFAYDYATHVADVDIMHGRFNQPLQKLQGGMHRRNKNHWSGAVQTQYTPSRGLYLMKWLSGNERLDDALTEVREFSRKNVQGSVYCASAWQNRYAETNDPQDLKIADELLQACIKAWEDSNSRKDEELKSLRGLPALYARNFRQSLDWWPIQIEFHRITDDPRYLQDLAERVSSDPLKNLKPHDLTIYYAVSYLLDQGYTPEQLGAEKITRMQEVLLKYSQRFLPMLPREKWNLSALTAKRAFSESLEFSKQVGCAPFVLGFFPTATAEPAAPAK